MITRRTTLKSIAHAALCGAAVSAIGLSSAEAQDKELKIGFVGVTSGPAAAKRLRILAGVGKRVQHFAHGERAKRVALRRTINCHARNAAALVVENIRIGLCDRPIEGHAAQRGKISRGCPLGA